MLEVIDFGSIIYATGMGTVVALFTGLAFFYGIAFLAWL
jgi:hypothetical protein